PDEFTSVVHDIKLHTLRKPFRHLLHSRLYGANNLIRIRPIPHYYDSSHHFPLSIQIEYAEAWFTGHLYGGNIPNQNRHTVNRLYRKIFDFFHRPQVSLRSDDIADV